MKVLFVLLAFLAGALVCPAQAQQLSDWQKLIGKKDCRQADCDQARKLCESYIDSKNLSEQVEAQKCLANVALCGKDIISLEGDDAGGGNIHGGFQPEAVDEALAHLKKGIQLAPQDLSIHQGRLHILEVSTSYDQMIQALDESCSIYAGKDALEAWLAYAPELADLRQYKTAVEFMKVLDKHYPNNPDVIGNIGAFYSLLKQDKDAIPYLRRSVELAPNDPINAWDLGRELDYAGQTEEADKWYQKGIALDTDQERRKESACLYAEFVEKKLKDTKRACTLQKANCPAEKQTACVTPASAEKKPTE
jgi:tetratricopeptide (TPR) repeat protein